jgi:hypothetical protein
MSVLSEVATARAGDGSKTTSNSVASRKSVPKPETNGSVRYFLAREGATGDLPQLGKEFSKENEVLLEAMRTGLNYYTVSEWKAIPDFSGKHPQILKQSVAAKQPHS